MGEGQRIFVAPAPNLHKHTHTHTYKNRNTDKTITHAHTWIRSIENIYLMSDKLGLLSLPTRWIYIISREIQGCNLKLLVGILIKNIYIFLNSSFPNIASVTQIFLMPILS